MNLDEKSLFLEAMEDVKPLKDCNSNQWLKPAKEKRVHKLDIEQLDNFLTTDFLEIIPLTTLLEFKREGLQTGVLDKLRLGKYSQQASLNLIRQPVEQCRQMLFSTIQQAKKEGLRNLLIVHGKGRKINPTPISCAVTLPVGWQNLMKCRRFAARCRTTAAVVPVTWRSKIRPGKSRKLGTPRQTQPLSVIISIATTTLAPLPAIWAARGCAALVQKLARHERPR